MKYIFQYPHSQDKVTLVWCQLCDVNSAVYYYNEGDIHISKREFFLPRFQQIDIWCVVQYYTKLIVQTSNNKIYLLAW